MDFIDKIAQKLDMHIVLDIMHLGWKGWLYVDEKIDDYRNQN